MTSPFRSSLIAVLIVVAALPAHAHSTAVDTSVSCPASTADAGFTDIGGLDATTQTAINCLKASGIAQGTTPTTFTPEGTVTRWQMALFLARQAAAQGLMVPAPISSGYADIGGLSSATQDAINQVTQLGIAKGTSSSTFSPNGSVTRWQMALFLRRLAEAAGVTVTDDAAHSQFSDIAAYSTEIQAAINFLADGHIALGTGGSLFSGDDPVLRWQMALFLTRVLAADTPTSSTPALVTVIPGDGVTYAIGDARYFTASFRNGDGTPYTGAVGLALFAVNGGSVEWDGAPAAGATLEQTSDGLAINGPVAVGVAGPDGLVTFKIRHIGGVPETLVAIAWQDSNDDNDPEITGNTPPVEPYAAGGFTDFATGILPNCGGPGSGSASISAVDKLANRFEVFGFCHVYYDANDTYAIGGAPTTMAGFEAALSVGDEITGNPYDDNPANQSNFNISIDNPVGTAVILISGGNNGGVGGILDTGDFIQIFFSEDVTGFGTGDTVTLVDPDGTTVTITCDTEATCGTGPANQIMFSITGALSPSGGSSPDIENQAEITDLTGIDAADDGATINALDAGVFGRTFSGF